MLFNSIAFIFWFLPIVVFGFFALGKVSHKAASAWLVLAAFFFYGYWSTKYIGLLIASILFNYLFGYIIAKSRERKWLRTSKLFLIISIVSNLSLLAYYKYSNFFLSQFNAIQGTKYYIENLVLPLGISFFTFTQIAFLVDAYQRKAKEYDIIRYFLFVTYFPHLIAGPILHHAEMMPQFLAKTTYKFNRENFVIGSLIFAIGLAKKVLLADNIAPYADAVFKADHTLTFWEGWAGAIAYTLQLYFDFSGYCDMAIGISKMFNIALPINFNSPYKSLNIIDFWRRWHITLSRFLRDYLYIPLGGNRKSNLNRYRNLLATMVLGGLWHGASWTFVLWGTLHGLYLTINHLWRSVLNRIGLTKLTGNFVYKISAWALTFLVVVIAWVFFRAENFANAKSVLSGMFGLNGITKLDPLTISFYTKALFSVAVVIILLLPNTQQIFSRYTPGLETYKGDIPKNHWLSYFNWYSLIEIRWYGYLWISYAISICFIILFYTNTIDATIFKYYPRTNRPVYLDMFSGDYRSNLFSNDIFLGNEKKVLIIGSSYTQMMGKFRFEIEGEKYRSASVANAGNSLTNGFRAAFTILDRFKVDTLIFGVSPLGFGNIKTEYTAQPTLEDQCVEQLKEMGFNHKMVPFKQCSPIKLSLYDIGHIALSPGDSTFFQFQNFLNKLVLITFYSPEHPAYRMVEFEERFTSVVSKKLDDWKIDIKEKHSVNPIKPPQSENGNDKEFHWLTRNINSSLDENGDVYDAFKKLKEIADKKGVKLVVYNSPTVSAEDAPHIYPKGFISSYRAKLNVAMNKLGIEYYDFGDDGFIWDTRYASDFIHIGGPGRKRIHSKLIENIFLKDKMA